MRKDSYIINTESKAIKSFEGTTSEAEKEAIRLTKKYGTLYLELYDYYDKEWIKENTNNE